MALIDSWINFIRMHGGEPGARNVFEKLMDELLREENPGKDVHIIQATRGDGGIDVYVRQAGGIDVYQCKFFMDAMDPSRWAQVKESFDRIIRFMQSEEANGEKLLRWFLCMPREMRKEDITKWNQFCKDREIYELDIQYIDGNEIIQRMQKCDREKGTNLIDRYFNVHPDNIPKCLTPIPTVNRNVGLVGREDTQKKVTDILETQGRMALVNGLGGIGKTAVMQWVCNEMKEAGKHVAWIDCGSSLKEDLLVLGDALGIPVDDRETAYRKIISKIKKSMDGSLYIFLDDLKEKLEHEEENDLNSLNAHIMATSRTENAAFVSVRLEELEEGEAVTMFFRYYNGDMDRTFEEPARDIVASVNCHTLLTELLAKAARKIGGPLTNFNEKLKREGVYEAFKRKIETAHDGNSTIEECVMRLYEIAHLTKEQKHILKLFSIFTPEKEIYYKVVEWAGFDTDEYADALDELVELGWLERVGPENNYKIHQIIRDSLRRQFEKQNEELKIEEYGDLLSEAADTDSYMPENLEYTKVRERLVLAEDIAGYLKTRIEGMSRKEEVPEGQEAFYAGAAALFNNMASVFRAQGDYEKALEYYGKALAISERVLGPEHPDTATTYNNMAVVYEDQGDYGKALDYYRKALFAFKKRLGENHKQTLAVQEAISRIEHILDKA